jgi:hypothetical protein
MPGAAAGRATRRLNLLARTTARWCSIGIEDRDIVRIDLAR